MMTQPLSTLEEVIRVSDPVEDVLFGVQLETETVAASFKDMPVSCQVAGMYSVRPGIVSFRAIFTVGAEIFTRASIDVAVNYSVPEDAAFAREAFFEFANAVATPHMRSYAQSILDNLLGQMKLPGKLLPPISSYDEGVFKADHAPDVIAADGAFEATE
ncbi:hypothetical protein [Schaalia sp.]|uniref:hypothetical protein n=1 Tax=Schaalia sp. TaxID=2691890 RepID=UPI003D11517D